MRVRRIFLAAAVLPPALLAAALWDVSRQEGWGGWALAGTLGPAVIGFSAVMTLAGVTLSIIERRRGRRVTPVLLATLVAASPCLWLLVRSA